MNQHNQSAILLVNGHAGLEVLSWFLSNGYAVGGVVLHAPPHARNSEELRASVERASIPYCEVSSGNDPQIAALIDRVRPTIGLSVYFGWILPAQIIETVPGGIFNVHPSLLPWNRGAHTNVWPLVDGSPAGVSLHRMDAAVDTGPLVAQYEVPVQSVDTAHSLYHRLEQSAVSLVQGSWPDVASGSAGCVPQLRTHGSFHRRSDLAKLDELDLDREYVLRDVLNRLRARTFPPHSGCWFRDHDGRRVQVRVELDWLDEASATNDPGPFNGESQ